MKNNLMFHKIDLKSKELGYNLLDGVMPEMIRDDGDPKGEGFLIRAGSDTIDLNYIHYLTASGEKFVNHIDIHGTAFTLIYKLPYDETIRKIFIGSYSGVFAVGEFELYASDSRDDILDLKNRIAYVDNRGDNALFKTESNGNIRAHQTCMFETEGLKCKYFAFKQLNTNAPDELSRIRNIGLYSDEFNKKQKTLFDYKGDFLKGVVPKIEGDYVGSANTLTNGINMQNSELLSLSGAKVVFSFDHNQRVDKLIVFGKNLKNLKVAVGEDTENLSFTNIENVDQIDFGREKAELVVGAYGNYIILSSDSCSLDQVLALSSLKKIEIDTDNVITKDFLSVGANVIPTHLFSESRGDGFNEVYMELEKRRIAQFKPNVVRLWFQVDWFIMDEEDYYNRRYVFNSHQMQALYHELDAFKEAGVEVEFNFGWKVGINAAKWFAIPTVFNRRNSAPRDIKQFAVACADLMYELIVNRGYDNIKHLSYYNESGYGDIEEYGGGDFAVPTQEGMTALPYFAEMFNECEKKIREIGLRDRLNIWCCEISGGTEPGLLVPKWLTYFNNENPDNFNLCSFHRYSANYSEAFEQAQRLGKICGNHRLCVSEYGTYDDNGFTFDDFNFERNNIATTLGYINGGLGGLLYWTLSGTHIPEGFIHDGGQQAIWHMPQEECKGVNSVSKSFYELALFTRYFPCHSDVVKTKCYNDGLHCAAIKTADGNYSVAVEIKAEGTTRDIEIDLGKHIGKKFYKHVYRLGTKQEGNMIIAPAQAEIEVDSVIKDTVDGEYSFIMYTTLPPVPQVVMKDLYVKVKTGEQIKLSASVIDSNDSVKWSICDAFSMVGYKGSITEDGVYTADHRFGRFYDGFGMKPMVAIKAELPTGEYGITVVETVK